MPRGSPAWCFLQQEKYKLVIWDFLPKKFDLFQNWTKLLTNLYGKIAVSQTQKIHAIIFMPSEGFAVIGFVEFFLLESFPPPYKLHPADTPTVFADKPTVFVDTPTVFADTPTVFADTPTVFDLLMEFGDTYLRCKDQWT